MHPYSTPRMMKAENGVYNPCLVNATKMNGSYYCTRRCFGKVVWYSTNSTTSLEELTSVNNATRQVKLKIPFTNVIEYCWATLFKNFVHINDAFTILHSAIQLYAAIFNIRFCMKEKSIPASALISTHVQSEIGDIRKILK
jgi:hypothetical protein